MEFLKRCYSVKANSLLESVVALSIISVCLYIAVMIYAAVFSPTTSVKVYSSQNKIYEAFFLLQIKTDSLIGKYENTDNWAVEEEESNGKKITIHYKDSVQEYPAKTFYIGK